MLCNITRLLFPFWYLSGVRTAKILGSWKIKLFVENSFLQTFILPASAIRQLFEHHNTTQCNAIITFTLELVRIDFSFLNYDVLILNQLGRLGLGLVIPLLRHYAAGVPLAIFQRPRADNELMGETISLNINDDTVMEFKCVTRHTAHVDIHSLLEQKAPLFVSTSNVEILQAVLSHTTSFSTSVGPCGFDDTIQGLEIARRTQYTRNNGIPRKVYLFENDAERFKKLIEERFGHEHFDIVHVMCDRICTQRHWKEDEVQVVCERYPGMAVVFPSKRDNSDLKLSFESR